MFLQKKKNGASEFTAFYQPSFTYLEQEKLKSRDPQLINMITYTTKDKAKTQ